ncbi:MAG: VWA domain-containing protein [Planctomycetota bacterium]|nr:VWA domain-containing protein [Planctomycetota bacterium]
MPIKKNIEKPNLSLMLVIDKSGSMGGHKIGLAKEAAIASAEVLKDHDRFGVVAFDGRAEWISPITSAADRTSIQNNIARLSAGGGTNIYPGLHEAYKALLEEDSKIRHVILLSDGQTQGSGYDTLVGHLTAEGMTLSTIGIGDGADQEFLQRLSSQGGGEAYFTNDFSSIPQIFTRETMRASKAMIVEEPFVPTVGTPTDGLKGVSDEDIPFLMGYTATQAKQRAEVALLSDYGDPILATWNYGLGRSAAFTSDAKARWASDWISWEGFGKFWGQLVRSVMNTGTSSDLQTMSRIEVKGGKAKIYQDVRDRSGSFRSDVTPKITLMKPNGEREELPSAAQGPGLFSAEFPIEKYGEAHHLVLSYELDGQVISMKTLSLTESYSPEYAELLPDPAALTRIAKDTGGSENAVATADFTFQGDPAEAPQDTFWWWLLAALILLPLDIALRRLGA